MIKTGSICVLVLCFLTITTQVQSSATPFCRAYHSPSYDVQWPNTVTQASSRPLCINSNKELSIRTCTNGSWDPEPECVTIQREFAQCPDNFTEIQNICYAFTPKSTFPPQCPFPDVLPFQDYIEVFLNANVEAVWMPIMRDLSNGLGFMQWIEASTEYKKEYVESYIYDGAIKGKNCMVFTRSGEAKAVSCKDEYPGICAYRKLKLISNSVCDDLGPCVQSDYVPKNRCFCTRSEEFDSPKAEFIQPYQNKLAFSGTFCNFGLTKSANGTYIWNNSTQEITYTYWSANATFDLYNPHAILTPDGWVLSESSSTCTLTMEEVPELDTGLKLIFDDTQGFNLFVNNSLWIRSDIVCFTDACSDTLIYRYPYLDLVSNSSTYSQFQFNPQSSYSGNYWCEGFRFSDSEVIKSEKIFHNVSTLEFIGFFKMELPPIDGDPLSSKIFPFVDDFILSKLDMSKITTSYFPRIMKIIDLDENNSLIFLNIHFSSVVDIPDIPISEKEFRYHELEDFIYTALSLDSTQNAQMRYFLSSDFCIGGTFSYGDVNLTWPTTFGNNMAFSAEFCFRSDGNLVTNYCGGNFIEGVFWMIPVSACTILPPSYLSPYILSFYLPQVAASEVNIHNILGLQGSQFNALDVFLTVEIFRNSFRPPFNLNMFEQFVGKILTLKPQAIVESQMIACSTDKVLDIIQFVMKSSPSSFQIIRDDFVLLLVPRSNISSLVVTTSNGQRNITILQNHWSPQRIIEEMPDLLFAIWLSPTLNQTDSLDQIGLMLFFNDTLFPDPHGSISDNVTTVFGMIPTGTNSSKGWLPGPVSVIYRTDPNDKIIPSCVSWIFDVDNLRGLWMQSGTYENNSFYHICSFWQAGYFSVALNNYDGYNVTADLEGLLEESVTYQDKLNRLAEISDKYAFFCSIDILLLGKVLDLVQNKTDNDLNSIGKIINNLHKIEKTILLESQQKHNATDLILHNIDAIIKSNHHDETEVLFVQDHFVLFVTEANATNFTGLLLLESNQSAKIEVLRDEVDIATIQFNESVSSAVLLSSDLKNQIPENSRIIITIFFSDVLFNQGVAGNRSVSKIFGVILPDIGNYSGPVSVFHNVPVSDQMKCAHWNYGTNQSNSSWKIDRNAANFVVSQCDFWHTTHFALLLFNDDHYQKYDVLDWFTTINSAVSLTSLLCIVLTGILFEKWRRNIGNQILLNFSLAIILQIVTFYIADTMNRHSDHEYCTVIGVLLHYSVISQFCWMLTIAFLQFKRFVVVFASSPRYLLIKACICGWGFPILPVMLSLVLNHEEYVMSKVGLCYPSGLGLYLGVWLPLGIIGLLNIIIFVYVMYSVFQTNANSCAHNVRHAGMHQWRLFVLLFFMLGLTWCFGFLSGFDFGIVFAYMFCFTATLQGFVLFLYFVVFNENTRRLYSDCLKNICRKTYK